MPLSFLAVPWWNESTVITIAAIAKNEGPYLLEWIAYHRVVGADRIIVMDNDSTDGSQFLLQALDGAGVINYIPWPTRLAYRHFENRKTGAQVPAYDFALRAERRLGRAGWIGFIDLDEFVLPLEGNSIGALLDRFPDAAAIGLNWRVFGSNGHEAQPAGLVMENFTRRGPDDFGPNKHVKTFARVPKLINPGIHVPSTLDGPMLDTEGQEIDRQGRGVHTRVARGALRINHYFIKSRVEWERKRRRGRAPMIVSDPRRIRDDSVFTAHDRNDIEDHTILRFLPEVKTEIARLRREIKRWLGRGQGLLMGEDAACSGR
ncbi:MAG TPA: glycosyltransferase family 2 protein [Roseomonas sp.]|nr:glycosyltransferase family 2 protein [Roseomonas sp.]